MKVRMISANDAEQFLELNQKLDNETKFMLLESGERKGSVDKIEERIELTLKKSNEAVFVLEDGNRLVGYASAIGGHCKRNAHKASIVTGVLQSHVGRGGGSRLFETLLRWAEDSPLHRLELTVMKHNERAIALYRKYGFEIEGIKEASLFVDGIYVDEYSMGLILRK